MKRRVWWEKLVGLILAFSISAILSSFIPKNLTFTWNSILKIIILFLSSAVAGYFSGNNGKKFGFVVALPSLLIFSYVLVASVMVFIPIPPEVLENLPSVVQGVFLVLTFPVAVALFDASVESMKGEILTGIIKLIIIIPVTLLVSIVGGYLGEKVYQKTYNKV